MSDVYGSSTHVEQEKGCPYQALATPQLRALTLNRQRWTLDTSVDAGHQCFSVVAQATLQDSPKARRKTLRNSYTRTSIQDTDGLNLTCLDQCHGVRSISFPWHELLPEAGAKELSYSLPSKFDP